MTGPSVMTRIALSMGGSRDAVELDLDDTPAGRSLLDHLPLIITLDDYAGAEKVSTPTRALSTDGAPDGYQPSAGDLTYYAPWGNLALFYRDAPWARGLVRLGEVHSGLDRLAGLEGLATLELSATAPRFQPIHPDEASTS